MRYLQANLHVFPVKQTFRLCSTGGMFCINSKDMVLFMERVELKNTFSSFPVKEAAPLQTRLLSKKMGQIRAKLVFLVKIKVLDWEGTT